THPRRARKNCFAFLLRHAAEHTDPLLHAIGLAKRVAIDTQPRKYLLGGLLADAARIVKNQARRLRRLDLPITARQHHSRHFLPVVLVHLAAKCLEEERPALRAICATRRAQLTHADCACRRLRGSMLGGACCPRKRLQRNVDPFAHAYCTILSHESAPSFAAS